MTKPMINQNKQLPDKPMAILFRYAPFSSVGIILFYCADGLILPLNTWLVQFLIDETAAIYQAGRNEILPLLPPVIFLALFLLLKNARNLIEEFLTIHMTNRLRLKYHRFFAEKLSRVKYEVFENAEKMDIFSRVSADAGEQAVSYLFRITAILSQVVSMAGVLYLLSSLAFWLAPAAVLLFLLYLWLDYSAVSNEVRQSYDQTQEARRTAYYSSLMSSKAAAKEMRTNRLQAAILQRWSELRKKQQKERYGLLLRERVRNHGIVRMISCVENIGILVLFGYWVYQGAMTVGQLVSYRAAIGSMLMLAMWSFPQAVSELFRSRVYWKDYREVLGYPEYAAGEERPLTVSDASQIEFRDVSFRYPGTDKEVLKHLSLSFRLDEKIALVGENGCGKSTLIKLLLGLYEPSEGDILLDGISLRAYSGDQRKKIFSAVFQDSTEYHLSVKEAIGLADTKNMEPERIRRAAQQGKVDEYIQSLPQKYDTLLGNIHENGIELSGGQWKRIAISRMYMADSRMKVLDEPTASLDPRAESELYEEALSISGSGIFIVTHRLGIARHVERVVLLQGGRVAADGPHFALMKSSDLYCRMYESQAAWYAYENAGESRGAEG